MIEDFLNEFLSVVCLYLRKKKHPGFRLIYIVSGELGTFRGESITNREIKRGERERQTEK